MIDGLDIDRHTCPQCIGRGCYWTPVSGAIPCGTCKGHGEVCNLCGVGIGPVDHECGTDAEDIERINLREPA